MAPVIPPYMEVGFTDNVAVLLPPYRVTGLTSTMWQSNYLHGGWSGQPQQCGSPNTSIEGGQIHFDIVEVRLPPLRVVGLT